MIEAVGSVLQTAPLSRGNAEQASVADSYAANPERIQKAPQAPYISPYVFIDVNFDMAVIQIRDSETGDVVKQIPSEASLEARSREVARRAELEVSRPAPQVDVDTAETGSTGDGGAESVTPAPAAGNASKQMAAFDAASRTGSGESHSVTVFA